MDTSTPAQAPDALIPPSPWARAWSTRPSAPVPDAHSPITDWGLAIDAPLRLANPDAHDWQGEADLIVVGHSAAC